MLKLITCNKNNYEKKLFSYLNKGSLENKKRSKIVYEIIKAVKKNKNNALLNYSNNLENNNFKNFNSLKVKPNEILNALNQCSKEFNKSVKLAVQRITSYQKKLMPKTFITKMK